MRSRPSTRLSRWGLWHLQLMHLKLSCCNGVPQSQLLWWCQHDKHTGQHPEAWLFELCCSAMSLSTPSTFVTDSEVMDADCGTASCKAVQPVGTALASLTADNTELALYSRREALGHCRQGLGASALNHMQSSMQSGCCAGPRCWPHGLGRTFQATLYWLCQCLS